MNRRLTFVAASAAALAVAVVPAHAATSKKKHPPIKGSYALSLLPDPTADALDTVKKAGCSGVNPKAKDVHPFTVPAAGTLHVVLDSADPTGKGKTDWDLYVLDSDGSELDASHGATSHEEITDKFNKGQKVSFLVCNLIGQPNATVSYTFTYA